MRRADRIILAVAAVAVTAAAIALQAAQGSLFAQRVVDAAPAHKEYLVAFVGLVVLAVAALGMDIRDWF